MSDVRLSRYCILVLLAFLAFPACARQVSSGEQNPDDPLAVPNDPLPTLCSRTDDCTLGTTCQGGVCVTNTTPPPDPTPTTCRNRSDCTLGMHCLQNTGRCVDCLVDQDCSEGVCKSDYTCGSRDTPPPPPPTGCTTAQCATTGKVCETLSGQCVECLSNDQCTGGKTCIQYQCIATSIETIACSASNNPCTAAGKICDFNRGVCTTCSVSGDCGPGKTCSFGVCTNSAGCSSQNDCGGQACYQGTCTSCTRDLQCQSGNRPLCDSNTGLCIDAQCTSATHCSAGAGCLAGRCGACSQNSHCRTGQRCDVATAQCIDSPTGTSTLGQTCINDATCGTGLFCNTTATPSYCTQTCIGNSAALTHGCPSGFACIGGTGDLDGTRLCIPAAKLPSTTPGQPFTTAPGDACPTSNTCQTGICFDSTRLCAKGCTATSDCGIADVCWTTWTDAGNATGMQICVASDVSLYADVGAACGSGLECNTGICAGQCSTTQNACNQKSECGASETCIGKCLEPCRTNAQCTGNTRCLPWPTTIQGEAMTHFLGACIVEATLGSAALGATCTQHEECNSDWCIGNVCTHTCAVNGDCTDRPGTSCKPTTFQSHHSMGICQ